MLKVFLSYPRSYVVSLFTLVHTAVASVLVLLVAIITGSPQKAGWVIKYLWARPLLWLTGTRVELRGLEHISPGPKGFLILFNHSSHADIPVLYGYFPKFINFGAKVELFKIPIFGRAMAMVGTLKIDRADRKGVMKIYEEAIARVNRGDIFALAPEGTRQLEPTLGRFKRGPFEFAVNAETVIQPVVVAGAILVLPRSTIWFNKGRWRGKVVMQVLPPISTIGLKGAQNTDAMFEELQVAVRTAMEPVYSALNKELGVV